MKKTTLGSMIATLRKEQGWTQLELAERMGVTDKAVSKWERDLSCPDVSTIPKLAELFGVSVDELMQVSALNGGPSAEKPDIASLVQTALKGVALAMGVAVTVLGALGELDASSAISMLGLGLACLAAASLSGPHS